MDVGVEPFSDFGGHKTCCAFATNNNRGLTWIQTALWANALPECLYPGSDDDDDSLSCHWSVASSDTAISWDAAADDDDATDDDSVLLIELDDYLRGGQKR